MSTLEKAIQIAAIAHTGQIDKAGETYILHPLKVMMRVETEAERIVAVLHDVVEDSDFTLEDLEKAGFSQEILEAVDALTKRAGETRLDAAKRAAQNKIARVVKLADNAENSDSTRIKKPTQRDFERLEEYAKVRELLENFQQP
ncbi:phosphohydrolase [Leptolyngbya sp. AN02str]|uniref:phosphohydrolase n=1 Tax=Leptolyngbya sp. AN02str TaxID=3423363 RepID=UPI003D318F4A